MRMKNTMKSWMGTGKMVVSVGLLAGVVALAGCAKPTPPPGAMVDMVALNNYPQITVMDNLQPWLVVNRVQPQKVDDLLNIDVDMRWTGKQYVYLEYRFIFFDDQGRALNTDPAWRTGEAAPGTVEYMQGRANNESADTWRLEIRGRFG